MAWTTKSDRFGVAQQKSAGQTAAAHIGPGHYKIDFKYGAEHGYAPFGSTDPRDTATSGALMCGAAPGSYNPKLPEKFDPGLPRKTVPFGVGATRIDMRGKAKTDFGPGPGDYKIDKDRDLKIEASRTMGAMPTGKAMLRSSSAPSIPQNHQSYGYEEIGGGRLVRQGPKDPSLFHSGRPHDSAGPGQYEPSHDAIHPRHCSGSFLKGPARSPMDMTGAETPGPGHYQGKSSSLEINSNSYAGGSSFISGTVRGKGKREEKRAAEGPGPGQYVQNQAKRPDLREMRAELQYFGSTTERFKEGHERSPVPDHVGPGSYAQLKRKPEPPNARSFHTTQERFKDGGLKPGVSPGPGQYQIAGSSDESMTGPMATFSMLGNSGGMAFGTMNKRFVYANDEGRPGPGQYGAPNGMTDDIVDVPEETDNRGKPKRKLFKASRLPGSAFASKTPKDFSTKHLVREGLQKPPPGAYDPVLVKDQATVVRLRSRSEGFLAGANRFSGGPLDAPKGQHPGPGKYSPQDITGGKRMNTFNRTFIEGMPEGGRPKGLGFDTQDRRFRNTAVQKSPGPGQYHSDPGWITKSHNCYFGDLT